MSRPSAPRPLTIASEILGPIDVDTRALITFPEGMYGFPECRRFALLTTPREGTWWLQSADHSALAFLLVDPFLYLPSHFHLDLAPTELARLQTSSASDILILAVVTMPTASGAPSTANLQAPILFNLAKCLAWQCIRNDGGFGVREEFDLNLLSAQPA